MISCPRGPAVPFVPLLPGCSRCGEHTTAELVSLGFGLVESFQQRGNCCIQSGSFFSRSPVPGHEDGEKKDVSGQKNLKILWHLAVFAEDDGGEYCAKPQIF